VVVGEAGDKPFIKNFSTWESFVDHLQPLHDQGYALVCHNAKYDIPLLTTRGFRLNWSLVYCTQVLAYLDRNDRDSYSLDALTGAKMDLLEELKECNMLEPATTTKEFWAHDWSHNPGVLDYMQAYCDQDTRACHKLYKGIAKVISEASCVAYHRVEQPMLKVLVSMERRGIPVQRELLLSSLERFSREVESHTQAIRERYGLLPELKWNPATEEYEPAEQIYAKGCYKNATTLLANYYSPGGEQLYGWGGYDSVGNLQQHVPDGLPLVVYNHCKLVPYNGAAATGHTWWLIKSKCPDALTHVGTTKTGKPQINKDFITDVAEHLPDDFPVAKLAKATKRLQTLTGYWKHLTQSDRIHPSFNHTQTLTGRLSASQPNLQNVERAGETEESQLFRKLIQAPAGKRIAVADLDAIELRVLAYYINKVTGDSSMADVLNSDDPDLHTANSKRWGVSRTVAKTLVFLLIYGGQPALMVKRKLFSTLKEAEAAFEGVHKSQPAIKQLMGFIVERCRKDGYITTIGGRRLHYPHINSNNYSLRGRAERQCFNALIQGSARDIMHLLATETQEVLECYGLAFACIINQVHDELIVEFDARLEEELLQDLNLVWQKRLDLLPGVVVNGDWHAGSTWYEAK
jgi:DNA polymerase I-like protein with 3'-5' exonuclease and polymerase domains